MNYLNAIRKVKELYYKVISQTFYKHSFASFGKESRIIKPLKIRNAQKIMIGRKVSINDYAFLMVVDGSEKKEGKLIIEDGTDIGHFNHIVCLDEVRIGKNVLTADHVFITDNNHTYTDLSLPISKQGVYSKGSTIIGDETWIGENACIISAKIGRHCVIGSNSVVTSDVPDYSVVTGIPAVIVKQYNPETRKWERKENG